MERGCLMVTVACVKCAEPIVMGPWSVEEVHFLTNEFWGVNFVESTICDVCIGVSLAENNECYDDVRHPAMVFRIPADGTLR